MDDPTVPQALSDERVAQIIHKLDPERFATLCRMHLSFLLDLTSDELEAVCKAKINDRPKRTFPVSLHRRFKGAETSPTALTHVEAANIYKLIELLGHDSNIQQEGLFRKNGQRSRQMELKRQLSEGAALQLDCGAYNVHDCANVLKTLLANLQEPLLTENHFAAHCQIADLYNDSMTTEQQQLVKTRQIHALQFLLLLLPGRNSRLLQQLLALLHRVSQEHYGNRMNATNLATMFAPHILRPRKMAAEEFCAKSSIMSKAVALMIESAPQLFQIPAMLAVDLRAYWKCKVDIRNKENSRDAIDSDQGIDDPTEVQTMTTFCDRQHLKESEPNYTTAAALAQLYSHIQAMPESAKKRHLLKQFNKENSQGSPALIKKTHQRSRSLKKSIKKHLFGGHSRHRTATQFYTGIIENCHTAEKKNPDRQSENASCHKGSDKQKGSSAENLRPVSHNNNEEIFTIRHPAFCPRQTSLAATSSKGKQEKCSGRDRRAKSSQCLSLVPGKEPSKSRSVSCTGLRKPLTSPVKLLSVRPLSCATEIFSAPSEKPPNIRYSFSSLVFYRPNQHLRVYRETML